MNTQELSRIHARVRGRVQGVSFRFFVQETAHRLGISGWVRNRWDGSVEIVAEADKASLDELLTHVRRGPRAANVTDVESEWLPATGEFDHFRVARTS